MTMNDLRRFVAANDQIPGDAPVGLYHPTLPPGVEIERIEAEAHETAHATDYLVTVYAAE